MTSKLSCWARFACQAEGEFSGVVPEVERETHGGNEFWDLGFQEPSLNKTHVLAFLYHEVLQASESQTQFVPVQIKTSTHSRLSDRPRAFNLKLEDATLNLHKSAIYAM